MTSFACRLVFLLLAAGATGSACAAAVVSLSNPDSMADIPRDAREREAMQAVFLEHLNGLSARLPQDQILKVEFLDIDLAGDVFPRVAVHDMRVLGLAGDRPLIHLRYTIEHDGKIVSSGERRLVNAGYLSMSKRYDRDIYGHEKAMLDDWFRKDVMAQR